MAADKIPLSLIIITLNEEKNLERCLKSADFVNDIVVLDSFSKDKTKEIALAFGATFIEQTWLGFGPQKKMAVGLAKNDWVLCLDADEEITVELKNELLRKWSEVKVDTGYQIPRISFYLNKWIRHGGWYPDYQLRLFNRQQSQWSDDIIHEKVIAPKIEKLISPMAHYVFSEISEQVATNNNYSSLQAKTLFGQGKRFSWVYLIVKPTVKFMETYFLKLGFLDGFAGFFISISAAYSVFLKWAKLWEFEKRQGQKNV